MILLFCYFALNLLRENPNFILSHWEVFSSDQISQRQCPTNWQRNIFTKWAILFFLQQQLLFILVYTKYLFLSVFSKLKFLWCPTFLLWNYLLLWIQRPRRTYWDTFLHTPQIPPIQRWGVRTRVKYCYGWWIFYSKIIWLLAEPIGLMRY